MGAETIGVGLLLGSTVKAGAGIMSSLGSSKDADKQKKLLRQQAAIEKKQLQLQARLSEAKLRRENRIRQAAVTTQAGAAGIGGSIPAGKSASITANTDENIRLLKEQTKLQQQQMDIQTQLGVDSLNASKKAATVGIASAVGGFATDVFEFGAAGGFESIFPSKPSKG